MRHIGPYLVEVKTFAPSNRIDLHRMTNIFTKYAGENIEQLKKEQFKPILSRLKRLKRIVFGKNITINLARLCPKLEKLDVEFGALDTESWPTLHTAHLHTRNFSESEFELCRRFLNKNPQLIELKITNKVHALRYHSCDTKSDLNNLFIAPIREWNSDEDSSQNVFNRFPQLTHLYLRHQYEIETNYVMPFDFELLKMQHLTLRNLTLRTHR